jgi:beta-lactamase class A
VAVSAWPCRIAPLANARGIDGTNDSQCAARSNFLLAAAVMQRVDHHQEAPDRLIEITPRPLLFNSPLTEPHRGDTMTIADLCHAALTQSDNTTANLLLESIQGPASFTAFSRSIGDKITRLDRWETSLNE